ncbi:MAG: hypothetical protein EBX39_14225 [Actinobacteria bacterium]|nr:hypothetical protein [Actinomycetota bacterium]
MKIRTLAALGVVALAATTLTLAGCSDSKKASSSTSSSTVSGIGGNVTAPVILNANNTSATVKVGQIVTFDMGQPASGGSFVATSDNTKVFEVTSEGKSVGTSTQNAGGKAVGTGVAKVSVVFKGSMNGMGTPTIFTITVQ